MIGIRELRQVSPVPGWPGADGAARNLFVVGPNPAMDRTEEIEKFSPYEVNRATVTSPRAGGKSFIVARTLRRLDRPVSLYGFLGGATGQYLRKECENLGIQERHTTIAGETRINTVLVDRHSGRATVVNEPGPIVSPAEVAEFRNALQGDLNAGDILIMSGSLPRGVDIDLYGELVLLARERGALSIIDADGEALIRAVSARPWAVKCNLLEFGSLVSDAPRQIKSEADRERLVMAMRTVVSTGVRLVIVTLGAGGLIAVSKAQALLVDAPPIDIQNATGSGDTLLGAFAAACADGAPLDWALRFGAAAASANAAVLVPDIGPSPDLSQLLQQTGVRPLMFEGLSKAFQSES